MAAWQPRLRVAATLCHQRARVLDKDFELAKTVLASRGVEHIPLKTAALTRRYYPPGTRPAADIDLLIHEPDLGAVVDALQAVDYRVQSRSWKHLVLARPGNQAVVSTHTEHPANPRPVELHTGLREAFRGIGLDLTAQAWSEAAPGLERHLTPRALFLHLAAHTSVDILERKARLIQLLDLRRVGGQLSRQDWTWLSEATTRHSARFLYPAAAMAQRLWPEVIPAAWLAQLEVEVKPELAAWLRVVTSHSVSYLGRGQVPRPLMDNLSRWPLDRREQITVWRYILLPGRWELADRYPRLAGSALFPLMYPMHVAYSGRRLFQRLRGRGLTRRREGPRRREGAKTRRPAKAQREGTKDHEGAKGDSG
jgi:hypothetical protein